MTVLEVWNSQNHTNSMVALANFPPLRYYMGKFFFSGPTKENWEFCADKKKSVWGYKACYDECFIPSGDDSLDPDKTCGDRPAIHPKVYAIKSFASI